jgi:Mg-chelatase subunit ChlD
MNFSKKKLFLYVGLIILGAVVLPVTIYYFQQQQATRSRAEKTVNITYAPSSSQTSSSLQIPAGSTFTLDVYLDPGSNSVSYVKLEMDYDASKFAPAGGFIPNQDVFSQVVEGPVDTAGKTTVTLSIGSDTSKAIKTKTKIGTLALKALDNVANTTSSVSFGTSTQALSVSNNSSYNENVIASTTPVIIQINKPQTSCGTSPSDAILAIDTSGSMNDAAGSSGTKISNAKTAAGNFIDLTSAQTTNRIGLVSFNTAATLKSALTNSFSTVKTQVNALTADGNTCIQCAILQSNQEITAHKRTNVKNAIILLTDGLANYTQGSITQVSQATAEQAALTAANDAHNQNGTIIYTIGLGKDVNSTFLQKIADNTGGQYYYSPTTDQLNTIYTQISQNLQGGSITGTVFNDANGNATFDSEEKGISGVLLQLYTSGSTTPQQIISTDSNGTYTMQNVCDGNYTLKQVIPTTWKQTVPASTDGYSFTMTNGTAVTDKDFGDKKLARCADGIDNDGNGFTDTKDSTCHTDGNPNNASSYDPNKDGEHGNSTCSDSKDNNGDGLIDGQDPTCHTDGNANNPSSYDPTRSEITPPTPTMTPSPTLTPTPTATPSTGMNFSLTVFLHGIGDSGDNANPTASSLSNKTPIHTTRNITVSLYDVNNNLVATASGNVVYSSASGNFVGSASATASVPTGKYTAKVWTDNHLTRLVSGILSLVNGQTNTIPTTTLIAGDVNSDNRLDIRDYNLLLGCYSDLQAAPNCTDDATKLASDLNDDNAVNQFDYNLFLREISTQPGE